MKNIIHTLHSGFDRLAGLSAFLQGLLPSFEEICFMMNGGCTAEEACCCCCDACCC